jgi:hypothetical protein
VCFFGFFFWQLILKPAASSPCRAVLKIVTDRLQALYGILGAGCLTVASVLLISATTLVCSTFKAAELPALAIFSINLRTGVFVSAGHQPNQNTPVVLKISST